MAKTRTASKLTTDLGALVSGAVKAVKGARSQESSRKESAFQSAVASGISYDAQIKFRQEQLDNAQAESFPDQDYIQKINESIVSTKRLARFSTYRTKYAESLAEMNAGHINAVEYAGRLKTLLDSATDPDLRLEIEGNIAAAETQVTTYKKTILDNQVKLARYDGTEKTLNGVINSVKEARARAMIGDNQDEVAEHDATLASLNSQLVQVRSENVVNNLVVAGTFSAFNSKEKLNTLNAQIDAADTASPVVINGKTYATEREYWEVTRNAYLSGNGSGIFADYFDDLTKQNQNRIDGDTAKFGFVPAPTIQSIKSDFEVIKAKPEFAPYLDRVESLQAQTVSAAVDTMAKVIVERAEYTGEFAMADTALKTLTNTYGVDTSLQQLSLAGKLNAQVNAAVNAGAAIPEDVKSLLPASDFPIPNGKPNTPTIPPGTPPSPTAPAPSKGSYKVLPGDNLAKIASLNGVTLTQLLDANPEYKANPALVKVDALIKIPDLSTPIAPVAPTKPTQPIQPNTPPSVTPPAPTPPVTPPPKTPETPPVTPTPTPKPPTEITPTGRSFKKTTTGTVEVYENGQRVSTTTEDNARKTLGYTG